MDTEGKLIGSQGTTCEESKDKKISCGKILGQST